MRTASCSLAGTLVAALALAGCGAEYTAGYRTVSTSVPNAFRNAPAEYYRDGAMDASFTTHTLTLLDRTGILLAVLGSAANAVEARREAIKQAKLRGQTKGKVYYTYETTPVVPGLDFRLSYSFGGTTGFNTMFNDQALRFDNNDVKFSEMAMRIDYWTKPFQLSGTRMFFGVAWTPRLTSIDFESTQRDPLDPADRTLDVNVIYMPIELSVAYLASPRVRLAAGVEYDPIMGLIDVLGLDVFQQLGAHVRADVMIAPWLFAYTRLDVIRANEGSSEFSRRVHQTVFGVGLSFQVPLRGKK